MKEGGKSLPFKWRFLIAKGFAMGAADLVPGVSGGTIAFITGIYDELLSTIAGLGFNTVKDFFREGPVKVWGKYNLKFLVVLGIGLLTAVFTLSSSIHWLQTEYPVELRAFFFGLVLASGPIIAKEMRPWSGKSWAWGILGFILAVIITSLPPALQSDAPIFLAFCGAIGICAMLLPGISGSFILLILGAYSSVIEALVEFDLIRISAFGAGTIIGLLAFSRLLSKILNQFRFATLAILTGFLLGSLQVLWPWKKEIELLYVHSNGRKEWLTENILPNTSILQIFVVVGVMIIGAALVTGIDRLSDTK